MTRFRLRRHRPRKIAWGSYKPYEPWNELEPLKSANWWAEKPETDKAEGRVMDKDREKERAVDHEPGVIWGMDVYEDKWGA